MARELSQAELLDFLCQAGGRVANAALLGHFKGFLRDPAAPPEELRRRRELFKGFVNSVATVKQEGGGGGGAKYVVLRKRYRELVGEEPKPGAPAPASPAPQAPLDGPASRAHRHHHHQQQAEGAPRAHGGRPRGECLGPRGEAEEEGRPGSRTCWSSSSAQELWTGPAAALEGPSGPRLPPSPSAPPPARCALLGGGQKSGPAGALPALPVGAPPSGGGCEQRVREWVAQAHQVSFPQPDGDAFEEGPPWPPGSCPSLDDSLRDRLPVFRSIRCQLALQDLDEFLEQESPAASEDSSSASGGSSDSCRGEGEPGSLPHPAPDRQNGCLPNPLGLTWRTSGEGLPCEPRPNGPVGPSIGPWKGVPIPERLALPGQITRGSSSEEESLDQDSRRPNERLPKARKVVRLPSPHLDAPLSPQLTHQRGSPNGIPKKSPNSIPKASPNSIPKASPNSIPKASPNGIPDTDGSPEHKSSLVPLEPREHAWLVKVATGSWLQARILFLEDPQLATRKDFISGYTVLHWLAKHGNSQVLLDIVTGAQKAGVALDVNVKSGCGYTPLHLAAMHGHQLVIRLLVQKLRCQVQVRDSSGKRPWQYLSSSTSGEIWQLLGAPKGKTIFPARPIARNASSACRGKSPELARKISRKTSLAAYLKPQHMKWKMANKYPALQETEEYSD